MQLSVIILNYNVRYFLELCVLSVQNALETIDGEIIVIDNNSSDDSCAMMQKLFPNVKLIQNKENIGFPKGNNIGVAQAQGEYICVLNPDTVVAEDTFMKVLAFAQKQSDLGIVGCKLIDGTGRFLPESKRGVPTPWVAFTKITGLYKLFPGTFGKYYAQHLSENQTGKVAILVGAFMVMKRDLYLEVAGFDEDCFMYSDDIDLSYRVLKEGRFNYYFHETTAIHYKGESTVKDETYMKRFQEAMNFFYKKHFKSVLFFSLFMKIGIVFFSLAKMFQGKPGIKIIPKSYLLYSANQKLADKLHLVLQKKVLFHDLKTEKIVISSSVKSKIGTEIILDNEFISFKKCIAILESSRNKGFTFKIIPKNANFLIGSNNSNERGEIIEIE
ncbi:glycosyltransferase family 2 protein [Flavobacterium sp. GSP27]|uniref:glycosyltransferase family 2 protein n=1 Tax=unclassified Flavobacterium TaxID=196869 RepID=UPI000F82AC29|nr:MULTISPECIES: glycosyltransferase family 2 protein [unclassified Flavobacterium]RTY82314.1 glycosyltransferase family 2 protein [Flavobacterium sp. ZB4P23]RTY91269.1 glycosyltransferase family 2 protein [Flavobacterium sp. GSN2]RTZ07297.1 glycosyltransferase family 2 protein [Flavobacterium sp. GSP6]RTZ09679.1 glycosyltransferase family 2 protein [Flavobacterium sp. GSP27]